MVPVREPANISIPVAIVIGSVIIAAGLYFGLRRPDPITLPPTLAPALAPAPVAAPGPITPPAPITTQRPVMTVVPPATVALQARETMQYHLPLLRERCRPPAGATARFTFNITFDPTGVQLIRGIVEGRGNPPGLAACVNDTMPALRVPPPGAVTPVEVALELQ